MHVIKEALNCWAAEFCINLHVNILIHQVPKLSFVDRRPDATRGKSDLGWNLHIAALKLKKLKIKNHHILKIVYII